jgi:hypothetical protein
MLQAESADADPNSVSRPRMRKRSRVIVFRFVNNPSSGAHDRYRTSPFADRQTDLTNDTNRSLPLRFVTAWQSGKARAFARKT